jgi:arylsulfatase A-like enzyme
VFVALGIYKPHYPHFCSKKHFTTIPDTPTVPPGYVASDRDDITTPDDGFNFLWGDFNEAVVIPAAREGYMACVLAADAALGEALDAVDLSAEPWIVIVAGDHGFQLGEKDSWSKSAPWDISTRTTLVMSGPGFSAGTIVDSPVTLVDIYPTLCDYGSVTCPSGMEGRSVRNAVSAPYIDRSIRIVNSNTTDTITSTTYISRRWTYIVASDATTEFYDKNSDQYLQSNLDSPSTSTESVHITAKAWLLGNPAP